MAPKLSAPVRPPDETAAVAFSVVPRSAPDPTRTSVQSVELRPGSSVVINIPVDGHDETNAGSATPVARANQGRALFRTRNYHNMVEDYVQSNLMLHGLVVKDRVKFEAIVRDLRDTGAEFRRLYDANRVWSGVRYPDPAIDASMAELADRLDRGDISSTEYAGEAYLLRSRLGMGLQVGARTDRDEVADIADLIRAANVSEDRANYILQVNLLRTNQVGASFKLLSNPLFRSFADRYTAVKEKYTDATYSHLRCDTIQASVRAKLIDIASGDVIWIGSHTLTELDGTELELEIGYRRSVSNYASILEFVELNNSREERLKRYEQDVTVPAFTYRTTVTNPRVLSATECDLKRRTQRAVELAEYRLASRVVAELIATIRIADE